MKLNVNVECMYAECLLCWETQLNLSVNIDSVVMINVMALQRLAANVSEYNRNGKIWLNFTLKASSAEFRPLVQCYKTFYVCNLQM